MGKSINIVVILVASAILGLAQDARISAERIRADVKFLSSDLLEGRGVGVRGGQLAAEFIATEFAQAGLKPAGDNGTYFQRVPLIGVTTEKGAQISASRRGKTVSFRWLDDVVGASQRQTPETRFDAEAVFVGHGIVAPEYHWDDYKDVDVRNKIVVLFTNEPSSPDPKFFGGRALTYYGRWTYKYEEALRKGALGAIIVHTVPTAGYGWDVVRSSWGNEQLQVKLAAGQPSLAFAGWVSQEAGERLLSLTGFHVDELLRLSETANFRPIPLGVRIRASLPTHVRSIETRNVAAVVPGSDPKLKSEAVVFSAHWDHLGIGTPVKGDSIYNGAVDNATGCGVLLELARAWAVLPEKPRRSALFLAVTAEEGGLRGSEYYAAHPIFPPGKTAADINYDGLYPFGRTKDISVSGAERTTLWPVIESIAKRMNLVIRPDAHPEQGHYYRSDHFSFAKVGIPAFSVGGGTEFYGRPPSYGEQMFQEYNTKHYHQPSDEYQDSWDFSEMEEVARFGFLIGIEAANQDTLPTWHPGDEFLAARQKSE